MIKYAEKAVSSKITAGNKIALVYLFLFLICAVFAEWLPLGFTSDYQDLDNLNQPPLQWPLYKPGESFHWLGTDHIGRDVLVNIIFGARTALQVSVPAMLMAACLGVFLGSVAGYYGDKGYRQPAAVLVALFPALCFLIFYGCCVDDAYLTNKIFINQLLFKTVVLALSVLLYKILRWLFSYISFLRKTYYWPVDLFVLKVIELFQSVPRLLLILSLVSFTAPSLAVVIGLSAFTFWPAIARLVRAETLKLKEMPFVEAAKALGFSDTRIIIKHTLLNALTPVIVAFAFGISSLIGLESTLSFLGIGIPADVPSWGRMMTGIKSDVTAWWLAFFPGLALCCTVLAIQAGSQLLIKYLNPK